MRKFKFPVIILVVFYIIACGDYTCPPEPLYPGLKGYATSEADSLIIKRYYKGSNFGVIADSSFARFPSATITSTDTIYYFYYGMIDGNHDVRIINPFDNNSIDITDINYELREGKSGGCQGRTETCYSPVTSYKANGIVVTSTNSQLRNRVVITK